MSRDATGIFSGWGEKRVACPVCAAPPGVACSLGLPGHDDGHVEHGVHWARTEADVEPIPTIPYKPRPTFREGWVRDEWPTLHHRVLGQLMADLPWSDVAGNRLECFMATDRSLTYTYGKGPGRRVYQPSEMHPVVYGFMTALNADGVARGLAPMEYNVCVLNYYKDERNHLGWHADDSPEQDPAHPIAVVSFGATREIWVKPLGATGHVPLEDRFKLTPGSLFEMPPLYQETHLHRIPKHTGPCGPRVSMTFRKLDR